MNDHIKETKSKRNRLQNLRCQKEEGGIVAAGAAIPGGTGRGDTFPLNYFRGDRPPGKLEKVPPKVYIKY